MARIRRLTLMLASVWQDVRYGARQLRLNPGFAAVAVLSLALGIGANTAIFQLVNAVRLRALPVERPEELAYIDFAKGSDALGLVFHAQRAIYLLRSGSRFATGSRPSPDIFAWSATRFNLATGGEARYAEGLFVSGDFFRVLGVQPHPRPHLRRGRRPPRAAALPAAVVSYAFWQREFAGSTRRRWVAR